MKIGKITQSFFNHEHSGTDKTNLDVTNSLPRIVADTYVSSHLLSMVVDLPVQSNLQVELALRESEALADERAGLAATSSLWSELQL